MAIKKKDLDALPAVTGNEFSLLAHAFRDYMLAVQDDPAAVRETLVDLLGWEPDQAEWVTEAIDHGVQSLFPEDGPDPRAVEWHKHTTIVRRKSRG